MTTMKLLSVLPVLLFTTVAADTLEMPIVFTDHMVLQRDMEIPVWGKAAPDVEVRVEFAGVSSSVTAGSDGEWSMILPSFEAGGPHTMTVSSDEAEVVLDDVLIGEVWLCSGQSNMRFKIREHVEGHGIAARASFPNIRLFMMDYKVSSRDSYTSEQLRRMAEDEYAQAIGWVPCNSETIREFSAVAFFFAQRLQRDLDVPVGLISNGVGASPAQAWTPRETMADHPQLGMIVEMWKDLRSPNSSVEKRARSNLSAWLEAAETAQQRNEEPPPLPEHPFRPGYLYEKMMEPLMPFAIRGILWYQGESNAQAPDLYTPLFETMIGSWRDRWDRPDLPFFYVQLPGYNNSSWPKMRDVQRQLEKKLINSGMVVSIDTGTFNDIHPPDKREVARRFALLALSRVYGENLVDSGPLPEKVRWWDENELQIAFRYVGEGLRAAESPGPAFILVHEDGRRESVTGRIDGGTVIIPLSASTRPQTVRYAWAPWPETTLRNSAGLPASPFELSVPSR